MRMGSGRPRTGTILAGVTFTRITVDPAIMGGAPCIRGMRVPVATVVAMVADGLSIEEILADLPYLEAEMSPNHFAMPPRQSVNGSCH